MDKQKIIEYARNALKKSGSTEPPVDLTKICSLEGIKVSRVNMRKVEDQTQRKVSGIIYVDNAKNEKQILVNEADFERRQLFTIAHELGHYFLHIAADPDGVIISFRGEKSAEEREADMFAAELLMPFEWVEREHSRLFFPTSSYLADKFGVSLAAMKFRLNEMELNFIDK